MRWKEMSVFYKIIYTVGLLCNMAAIVLCVLNIAGNYENGLNYALLLLAVNSLCSGIQYWTKAKGQAIFSLAVAAFLFVSQIYILLILR